VLTITLILILARPGRIGEAWWAILGGAAALALGLVSVREAAGVVLEAREALILLVGMMLLSAVAEEAGFFEWAADAAARAGHGSVFALYGFVFLLGTLVTATLSLDATAIVLTPIVHGTVVRLRLSPLPFMFACVYTANTASLFLPVSNLTNLLVYEALDLGFLRFALVMLLPAILAVLTNFLIFALLFRNDLRGRYERTGVGFAPANKTFFRVATGGIAGVLAAFVVAPLFGLPVGPVALAAGVGLAFAARAAGWVRLRRVGSSVSWGVVFLVVGLFVVVQGAENAGLAPLAAEAFALAAPGDGLLQVLGVAFGAALGSNLINNVPMTVLSLGALGPLVEGGRLDEAAAYAVLLGTNVGPNLTVVGSLATLIWLSIARGRGLDVTARSYLKTGAISTPPILLAAVLGLWVSLRLFGG